jgi:hypothetical protein
MAKATGWRIDREQSLRFRLLRNHLDTRLPAGSLPAAVRFGLQDSAPRDALLGLHARVTDVQPDDWADPRFVQTYSPRAAVYLLPADDFGVFTLGRLPLDPDLRSAIEDEAEQVCRFLAGREVRGGVPNLRLRDACASGRIALRWTTSALYAREVQRPAVELDRARQELCRRHLQAFGPSTPVAYGWWSGLSTPDARQVWKSIEDELIVVELDGQRGWILAEDEEHLRTAPEPTATRLLVAPDLRVLGQDRLGLFAGPGQRRYSTLHDSFHPGGVLFRGRIVGVWGRKGGAVDVRLEPESIRALGARAEPGVLDAIEAEVSSMPIPGATMSVTIDR